jgi:hypothetical protein
MMKLKSQLNIIVVGAWLVFSLDDYNKLLRLYWIFVIMKNVGFVRNDFLIN